MKRLFERDAPRSGLRTPRPSVLPARPGLNVSALYRGSRIGGDYFDFFPISESRLVFLLSDVAGKREEAMHIAASVQDTLHERTPEILAEEDGNDADNITELVLELNRTIMEAAGGVRAAPTFLGCLDERFGLLHYVNAGHTPAFIKTGSEVTQLDPTGLPLGLFSHATHDAQVSVAHGGASIVLVSKGMIEVSAGRHEFGIERVRQALESQTFASAQDLCHHMIQRAVNFAEQPSAFGPQFVIAGFRGSQEPNDLTVVCLMRLAQAAAATGD